MTAATIIIAIFIGVLASLAGGALGGMIIGGKDLGPKLAAMMGAFFILDDPIFSGLAVSLIFGLFVSTILTLVVIPVVYYGVMHKRLQRVFEQA